MRIEFLQLDSVKSDNKVLNDYTFFLQPTGMNISCSPGVSEDEDGCGDHGGSSKRDKITDYGRWGRTSQMTICLFYT